MASVTAKGLNSPHKNYSANNLVEHFLCIPTLIRCLNINLVWTDNKCTFLKRDINPFPGEAENSRHCNRSENFFYKK